MDTMLSQDEINALLAGLDTSGGGDSSPADGDDETAGVLDSLTSTEMDAIGEIANISMGTAATTISTLLNKKVNITTPTVSVASWNSISELASGTCVYVQIAYKEGISGKNVFILKESDVKVITDLMMGGDGNGELNNELNDLHLSAISEAMNQMMGSAATSLSTMLNRKIDICAPIAKKVESNDITAIEELDSMFGSPFVKVLFKVEIEDQLSSEMMQLFQVDFVKEICSLFNIGEDSDASSPILLTPKEEEEKKEEKPQETVSEQTPATPAPSQASEQATQSMPTMPGGMPDQQMQGMPYPQMQGMPYPQMPYPQGQMPYPQMAYMQPAPSMNVQPVQFAAFTPGPLNPELQNENIDLIMDVPLEVTVELGRTNKSIKEILDFKPGTIVELNRIAGEPVDILVNGKFVAKGEVVVIDESFGIRVTDIVK